MKVTGHGSAYNPGNANVSTNGADKIIKGQGSSSSPFKASINAGQSVFIGQGSTGDLTIKSSNNNSAPTTITLGNNVGSSSGRGSTVNVEAPNANLNINFKGDNSSLLVSPVTAPTGSFHVTFSGKDNQTALPNGNGAPTTIKFESGSFRNTIQGIGGLSPIGPSTFQIDGNLNSIGRTLGSLPSSIEVRGKQNFIDFHPVNTGSDDKTISISMPEQINTRQPSNNAIINFDSYQDPSKTPVSINIGSVAAGNEIELRNVPNYATVNIPGGSLIEKNEKEATYGTEQGGRVIVQPPDRQVNTSQTGTDSFSLSL